VIAEYGENWTDPGIIVTNGPFVLDEWHRGARLNFLRNPRYPKGINDDYGGNIERITTIVVRDVSTMYSLYRQNLLDTAYIPYDDYERATKDAVLSKQIVQPTTPATFYFGFMYDQPPFDKVGVRRAFRPSLIVRRLSRRFGREAPTAHFMPPGIPGALPSEVGLALILSRSEYAKAQLAEAGLPTAKFPDDQIMSHQ
jgi:oligopeptide transport system substrate-binding protein